MNAHQPTQQVLGEMQHNLFPSTSRHQPYRYEPMREGDCEIRLLTLLPGNFSSPTRISLHKTQFTNDSAQEFEALSYAWGSTEDPVDVFVGKTGRQTIRVTRNLAGALPYLRYNDKSRLLWIDAICVNQQDLRERSSQVKRMPDIYSRAVRVVVWLGLESEDSELAMQCIKTISSHIAVDWRYNTMAPFSAESDAQWSNQNIPLPFDKRETLSICRLLSRNWFSRLWIWQEVHLARLVTVMCGRHSIPWEELCETIMCYTQKPQKWDEELLTSDPHLLYYLCKRQTSFEIQHLLSYTRYAICSDPRDRVFALLSLLRGYKGVKIEADYTKSYTKVYQNVIEQYITGGNVQILSAIEMNEHLIGCPSWVPDWSLFRVTNLLAWSNAAGDFRSEAKINASSILQIAGVHASNIEIVEAFDDIRWTEPAELENNLLFDLRRVLKSFGLCPESLPTWEMLLELCETLCCSEVAEGSFLSLSPVGFRDLHTSSKVLQDILAAKVDEIYAEESKSKEMKALLQAFYYHSRGRSLFRSTHGHFGLAPQTARPGDAISVVLGFDYAFVLRTTDDGRYKAVGQAYYHSVMHGEALLGPLPDTFTVIWQETPDSLDYPGFVNRRDGTVTGVDPRWPTLPPSWQLVEQEDQRPLFVCGSTGEETRYHPGLTREVIEKRGVEVRVFDIV